MPRPALSFVTLHRSALGAFVLATVLATAIAFGLSGTVVLASWLVPDETHEFSAPTVVD
ncbi:MAG: hypothetical protein U0183_05710 [Polyangiaceae bacterium]